MLTWIKGKPLPGELVDDILKALKLQRLSVWDRRRAAEPAVRVEDDDDGCGD